MNENTRIEFYGCTTNGPYCENEDFYGSAYDGKEYAIAAVCDGTPGEKTSGKITANYTGCNLIKEEYLEIDSLYGWKRLVEKTNNEVYEAPELGYTTLAFAQVECKQNYVLIRWVNIGDTRIYLLHNKTVELLTIDDRYDEFSGELSQAIGIKPEELEVHCEEIMIPCSEQDEFALIFMTDGAYELLDRKNDMKELNRAAQLLGKQKFTYLHKQMLLLEKKLADNATLCALIVNKREIRK